MLRVASISILIYLFIIGCSKSIESIEPDIDSSLPKVESIKTLSDIKSIAFEWKNVDEPRVKGYYLYRGESTEKLKRVAKIDDRFSSHYADRELKPDTLYLYRFSSFDESGKESELSETVKVKTLKPLKSVTFIKAVGNLPRKVKIIWRPHQSSRVKEYIVQRSEFAGGKWREIARVSGKLQAEYIDRGLKDNYTYRYRVKVETFDKIVSLPSEVVEVTTKKLPPKIKDLSATTDRAGEILLNWTKIESEDIAYYNIYRAKSATGDFELIKKVENNKIKDVIGTPNTIRFYRVSAIDRDDLESKLSEPIMGSTISLPEVPVIKSAGFADKEEILISWNSTDRAKKFIVLKEEKSLLGSRIYEFTNINTKEFRDRDLKVGVEYIYSIKAVDEHGLISKPTVGIKLMIPKEK